MPETNVSPRREAPMAVCPYDGAPLISTIAFAKAEFYCLECGAKLGFLRPRAAQVTPELNARYEALRAEWDEHVGGKLLYGWRTDCEECAKRGPYHFDHATEEEVAAHQQALAWLKDRVRKAA